MSKVSEILEDIDNCAYSDDAYLILDRCKALLSSHAVIDKEEIELVGRQQLEIERLSRETKNAKDALLLSREAEDFARNDARTMADQVEAMIPDNIHFGGCLKERIDAMVEEIQLSRLSTTHKGK